MSGFDISVHLLHAGMVCALFYIFYLFFEQAGVGIGDFQWYRRMRGGVWIEVRSEWRRCADEDEEFRALGLADVVEVEDHRRPENNSLFEWSD